MPPGGKRLRLLVALPKLLLPIAGTMGKPSTRAPCPHPACTLPALALHGSLWSTQGGFAGCWVMLSGKDPIGGGKEDAFTMQSEGNGRARGGERPAAPSSALQEEEKTPGPGCSPVTCCIQ